MEDFPDLHVIQIFNIVAELEEGAQQAYLAQLCADRPEWLRQVQILLERDKDPASIAIHRPLPDDFRAARQMDTTPALSPSVHTGMVVGNYRIAEVIGRGGMGVVYAAQHVQLERRAVVKVLAPDYARDDFMCQQFIQEAENAARIKHPGVVDVLDVGRLSESGELFILMEHLEGQPLARRLARRMPLARASILPFTAQIFDALSAVHDRGIVHCDLKPDNMFIVSDPAVQGGERVKLLDFGIARLLARPERDLPSGCVVGTPPYMAPEQWLGQSNIDHRVDLYAMGVLLFQFITGRRPFECKTQEEYKRAHLMDSAPWVSAYEPKVWPELDRLVFRLLCKNPDDRYASARAVCEELRAMATSRQSGMFVLEPPNDPLSGAPTPTGDRSRVPFADNGNPASLRQSSGRTAHDGLAGPADSTRPDGINKRAVSARQLRADTLVDAGGELVRERAPQSLFFRGLTWLSAIVAAIALGLAGVLAITQLRMVSVRESPPTLSPAELLERDFDNASTEGRREIVECIRLAAPIGAAPILARALREGPAPVRRHAIHSLSDLQWTDMAGELRKALTMVGGAQRVHVAAALAELADWQGKDILERALSDRNPEAQLLARYGLALMGRGEVADELHQRAQISTPGSYSWKRALRGLLALGDSRARGILDRALSGYEPEVQVLSASLLSLYGSHPGQQVGQASAVGSLRRMVHKSEFKQRGQAALALARLGQTVALGYVARVLDDPAPSERRMAIAVAARLTRLGGQKFALRIAEMAESDPFPEVRTMARVASVAFHHDR